MPLLSSASNRAHQAVQEEVKQWGGHHAVPADRIEIHVPFDQGKTTMVLMTAPRACRYAYRVCEVC